MIAPPKKGSWMNAMRPSGYKNANFEAKRKDCGGVFRGKIGGIRTVAGAVVVLAALLGAAWYLSREDGAADIEAKTVRTPKSRGNASRSNRPAKHNGKASKEETKQKVDVGRDMEEVVSADAQTSQEASEEPRKMFTNAVDQVLALAMDIRPGMDMPPLPPGAMSGLTKEQLRQMFSADIDIGEGDTEQVKELKMRVKDARAAMLERLDAGESFDDVLAEHRKMVNENAAIYRQCEEELREIIAKGDEAEAIEYREVINKALNEMGIDGLTVPITEDEREAQREMRRSRHREKIEKPR